MKRFLICALIPLALAGCLGAGTTPAAAPAPLAQTAIDDQALVAALRTYDLVLTLVDAGVDAGMIKGQRAADVKAALVRVSAGLGAARAALRAGNTASYTEAIAAATTAIAEATRALS